MSTVTFEKMLELSQKLPFTVIDRESFLREQLSKIATPDKVEIAIKERPSKAGISVEDIRPLAEKCISDERFFATSGAFLTGMRDTD